MYTLLGTKISPKKSLLSRWLFFSQGGMCDILSCLDMLGIHIPTMDSHGSCENHRLWTIWTLKINTPSRSISPLIGLGCIQSKLLSSYYPILIGLSNNMLIWILQIFTWHCVQSTSSQRKWTFHDSNNIKHDLSTTKKTKKTIPQKTSNSCCGSSRLEFSFAKGAVQVRKWLSSLGTSFFSPARPVNRRTGRPKKISEEMKVENWGSTIPIPRKSVGLFP